MNNREHLILYVDDEVDNRLVFRATFGQDFRILTTGSTEESIRALQTRTVALLITDHRMTDATGLELLERARAECPATIRMVLTAYSDPAPILHALNRGLASRYVIKPWRKDELAVHMRWALDAYARAQPFAARGKKTLSEGAA